MQGKTPKQIKDSEAIAYWTAIAMLALLFVLLITI